MSIHHILMPQLGESVTEGTIEKWLVQPGDQVNKYDPLADVTTDKVNAEIPSLFSGIIKKLIAKEGDTLPVGAIVCTIEVEEKIEVNSNISSAIRNASLSQPPVQKIQNVEKTKREFEPRQKHRYSPAVLKLANEHNINLELVEGTGLEGRITRKDIMKLISSEPSTQIEAPVTKEQLINDNSIEDKSLSTIEQSTIKTNKGDIEIPVTSIRRAIANNMIRSKQEVPHAWMMMEADVTNLVSYREKIKDEFKANEGFNLTYFAFFVKAVSIALKEFPIINSVWANDKIIQKKDINISIAVATEDALYVPVIKNVDDKSIKGIAKEVHELSTLVRTGKLRSEHIEGGTFTVNNTGSFGSIESMGIINYPQAAILQVESIVKRPVVLDGGMFAARDIVKLCLSLDHRILDGLICGKFLKRVKYILENVDKINLDVY